MLKQCQQSLRWPFLPLVPVSGEVVFKGQVFLLLGKSHLLPPLEKVICHCWVTARGAPKSQAMCLAAHSCPWRHCLGPAQLNCAPGLLQRQSRLLFPSVPHSPRSWGWSPRLLPSVFKHAGPTQLPSSRSPWSPLPALALISQTPFLFSKWIKACWLCPGSTSGLCHSLQSNLGQVILL